MENRRIFSTFKVPDIAITSASSLSRYSKSYTDLLNGRYESGDDLDVDDQLDLADGSCRDVGEDPSGLPGDAWVAVGEHLPIDGQRAGLHNCVRLWPQGIPA